jgi:hypothetical protein
VIRFPSWFLPMIRFPSWFLPMIRFPSWFLPVIGFPSWCTCMPNRVLHTCCTEALFPGESSVLKYSSCLALTPTASLPRHHIMRVCALLPQQQRITSCVSVPSCLSNNTSHPCVSVPSCLSNNASHHACLCPPASATTMRAGYFTSTALKY